MQACDFLVLVWPCRRLALALTATAAGSCRCVNTLDNGLTSSSAKIKLADDRRQCRLPRRHAPEPKGRTGFAHLFEHLMFRGTPEAPKGVRPRHQRRWRFQQRFTCGDYTNYIETAPVSRSSRSSGSGRPHEDARLLGGEPQNQQDVVKEEIRVNAEPALRPVLLGRPQCAGLPEVENNHDGYGSFTDLENAKLDDVRAFHRDFYGPNNGHRDRR